MSGPLIIHSESSTGWGGQEIRILQECSEFKKLGYRIKILANSGSQIIQNAPRYGVDAESVLMVRKGMRELFAMINKLRELKPTFIVTHSSTDHWLVAIARIFLKGDARIIRTRHVSALVHRNFATRWLYNSGCDAIMTTGEAIRQHLIFDGFVPVNKVFSVPTGIDLSYFKSRDKQSARILLGVSSDEIVFCNIGTLRSWKGQEFLIRAFAEIRVPNSKLVIVGDGPMRNVLQNLLLELDCARHIIMVGQKDDIRPYLDASDIFVFPSFANEGVPQAVLQAMAFSLPIITTRVGAIPEAVDEYPLVNFVAEKNVRELRDAMRDAAQRLSPIKNALSLQLIKRIDLKSMTRKIIDVFNSTLEESKPSLFAYLIGNTLTPSSRQRYLQYEQLLAESFEIRRIETTGRINFFELFRQPKVILFQKYTPRFFFWGFYRLFLRSRIFFDCDDAIWESTKRTRSFFAKLRIKLRLVLIKLHARAVIMPSVLLIEKFRVPRSKAVMLPMAISKDFGVSNDLLLNTVTRPLRTIGWAGHPQSHYLIESISESLKSVFENEVDISFLVLSGSRPKLGFNFEWLPFSLQNEERFFRRVDIGLVPLGETPFDLGKSPIKVLQHFSCAGTVIYSGSGAVKEMCNDANSFYLSNFSGLDRIIHYVKENHDLLIKKRLAAFHTFQFRHTAELNGGILRSVLTERSR